MTSSKVSVIVLGYNGREYLDACIGSLVDQEMAQDDYELLYVDNDSTDESVAFVSERFPTVRVIRMDRNYGFAEGNNRAISETKGRYIAVLNQDTVCHRRWLSELSGALDARPDVMAVHSNVLTPWCPGFDTKEREAWPEIVHIAELSRFGFVAYQQRPFAEDPIETLFLGGAATMVRREVVERAGYLFERSFVAYCEDTDLALRIRNSGHPNLLVPTAVVYHDLTPTTGFSWLTLRKTLLIVRNRFLAFFKNMNMVEFMAYLPWLVVGAPLKPGELNLGARSVLYALGMVALVPIAMLWAAFKIPSVLAHRAQIISGRTLGRFGMLRLLLRSRTAG